MRLAVPLLLLACVSVWAQFWIQTPHGLTEAGKTNLVSRVATNGYIAMTFEVWEPCFSAAGGGCNGHQRLWTEHYTNGAPNK